ncbi:protoheme IX farnesyltransferase 1 [mine drainage metagenome]|uniref:Protoheme IX farnesyltransferase 1 n=1 Tax=mine drainage metagenome TaxID=410659 RepID=A0A1J5R8U9_9ZZZZ
MIAMDTTLRRSKDTASLARKVLGLFKLRIGFVIMVTALAGFAVTPGPKPGALELAVLALSVLVASASAGAFNQYVEYDSDRLMVRTRDRAFATGALPHRPAWLVLIGLLLAASVTASWLATNPLAALYVFLGAFFYAVVYTVWLKRRTWLNIVVGGLAGSFSVLAGAAAVNPALGMVPLLLAVVLFLWTPPHFWSLAIANNADYQAAGVPMLPVVVGTARAARIVFASTIALVGVTILPIFFGAGPIYLVGALTGGAYFVFKAWQLARAPSRKTAMGSFFASLLQLSVLLVAAMIDSLVS